MIKKLRVGFQDENVAVRKCAFESMSALCEIANQNQLAYIIMDSLQDYFQKCCRNKDPTVWRYAYNPLWKFCSCDSEKVLAYQKLMKDSRDGFFDDNKDVRKIAYNALSALCEIAHQKVIVDLKLIEYFQKGCREDNISVREYVYKALFILCRVAPQYVLANEEVMNVFNAAFHENELLRRKAQDALCYLNKIVDVTKLLTLPKKWINRFVFTYFISTNDTVLAFPNFKKLNNPYHVLFMFEKLNRVNGRL